jgi:hypothetical protein
LIKEGKDRGACIWVDVGEEKVPVDGYNVLSISYFFKRRSSAYWGIIASSVANMAQWQCILGNMAHGMRLLLLIGTRVLLFLKI